MSNKIIQSRLTVEPQTIREYVDFIYKCRHSFLMSSARTIGVGLLLVSVAALVTKEFLIFMILVFFGIELCALPFIMKSITFDSIKKSYISCFNTELVYDFYPDRITVEGNWADKEIRYEDITYVYEMSHSTYIFYHNYENGAKADMLRKKNQRKHRPNLKGAKLLMIAKNTFVGDHDHLDLRNALILAIGSRYKTKNKPM